MKRVLITGKTSWIGDELERRLAFFGGEYEVARISLRNDSWRSASWKGYDSIVHTAAIPHDDEGDEDSMRDVNVSLTRDVAAKAKQDGVGHLIFLSSFHVYASDSRGAVIVGKNTLPRPQTPYGRSKLAAEDALAQLADDRLTVAILRPPLVYGPNCTQRNFPRFVKLAAKTPVFPNVRNRRSMLYSQNLAELMRLLINEQRGGLFFPQNEDHVCTADMISRIGNYLGRKIHLSRALAVPANLLATRIGTFGKIFGDAYYELSLSECGCNYRVATFDDSIAESIIPHRTSRN